MDRKTAIFLNGGAGRMVSSIPAVEKYLEENPDKDPILICEGGTDVFKGHPKLHFRAYDNWHKNLFQDLLKDRDLISPEPYRIWEYYNQKCSLAQAYDIAINDKGIRDLPKPNLKLSKEELLLARKMIAEVKEKTGKDKVIVFQPFGRGAQPEELKESEKEKGRRRQEEEQPLFFRGPSPSYFSGPRRECRPRSHRGSANSVLLASRVRREGEFLPLQPPGNECCAPRIP